MKRALDFKTHLKLTHMTSVYILLEVQNNRAMSNFTWAGNCSPTFCLEKVKIFMNSSNDQSYGHPPFFLSMSGGGGQGFCVLMCFLSMDAVTFYFQSVVLFFFTLTNATNSNHSTKILFSKLFT